VANPCPIGTYTLQEAPSFAWRTIKELEQFSVQNNLPLYQSLKSMDITVPYIKRNVKELIEFIDPLIRDAKEMKPGELIQIVRESLDYDSYIADDDIPSPDDAKILNIEQLQMAASKYNDSESFLKHVDTFQGESKNDSDGISLMTIHKAKGLEFSVVFVIGMVEGILPSKQGDIEEERRVAFVALSRAKEMLYLSAPLSYTGKPHKKSVFLSEITE
jgi:DNA helicase-2/ATP-dependent DNA helicase PcrA